MIDAVFFIAAMVGLVAGFALVARNPTFWVGMAMVVWVKLKPFVLKRMPKEDEDKINAAIRRGEDPGKLWEKLRRERLKRRSST